jgi:hypothetical protein
MPTSDSSSSPPVPAIAGHHTAGGSGVLGDSAGVGVFGESTGVAPATGVQGASTDGRGVTGESGSSQGVLGVSRTNNGVQGNCGSRDASGVYGENGDGWGAAGRTRGAGDRAGVWGDHLGDGPGVFGTGYTGVFGASNQPQGAGVQGSNNGGPLASGVFGTSTGGAGVKGLTFDGAAVFGECLTRTGLAGRFDGNVVVSGSITKGGGSFVIDHPLDPANKYLRHSFVESPDMMNVYNGIAVLDATGEADVQLPIWFEALNDDYRYNLTPIGAPGPNLYVADEVGENRFRIAGGTAGTRVSWQVTGIRRDPYAVHHRVLVEEDKPEQERGRYLHPTEHGLPDSLAIRRARDLRVDAAIALAGT